MAADVAIQALVVVFLVIVVDVHSAIQVTPSVFKQFNPGAGYPVPGFLQQQGVFGIFRMLLSYIADQNDKDVA
ncbi:MAG: hypothetical protein AAFO99_01460 [Bacteroidota bacterium]